MTWTVFGQLLSSDGAHVTKVFTPEPRAMFNPIKTVVWTLSAAELRSTQPRGIPLLTYGPSGRVIHLEQRRTDGSVWCVADLDVAPPDEPCYLTPELVDGQLLAVALARYSDMIGHTPAVFTRNGLDQNGKGTWRLPEFQLGLLEHAARVRHKSGDLTVQGAAVISRRPAVEIRSAGGQVDVNEHSRTIELIVIPYEATTVVDVKGRLVEEVVSRGAFDGIKEQTNKVRVNRDHQFERTVGRATTFDPHDRRGLRAELRIARTALGDETLALAEDGVLDASAGFGVIEEKWETRDRRRLTKLWLHHVALTPDPAYRDAEVLSVRDTSSATPNLAIARELLASV